MDEWIETAESIVHTEFDRSYSTALVTTVGSEGETTGDSSEVTEAVSAADPRIV